MSYTRLDFELDNGLAWITLNRPAAHNALDAELCRELLDVAERCAVGNDVRAVVITGAGDKAFCAGGDVAAFAASPDTVDRLLMAITTPLHAAISKFAWMDAPVIAAVNGVAAGAGMSLVAACDLAISADSARFTSAYTQLGFTPDGSSTWWLPRVVGPRRAMELYLTNRVLDANEALEWGLVNRVVPKASLSDNARALATSLANGPTRAHGSLKKMMLTSTNDSLESQMEREARAVAAMSRSEDGLEGVRAFVEKRKPRFAGR